MTGSTRRRTPTGPRNPLAFELYLTLLLVLVFTSWCITAVFGGTP